MDDLQYYSTDNLAEEQENYDEGVRKYLEKLPSSNRSNGTMEMTRSTTPLTIMTTAADTTIQGSRPTTPNGITSSVSNGRITAFTEPDSRSHISQKSAKGSPYSVRKHYTGDTSDQQPLRPSTPTSLAQYSDGIYIGTTTNANSDLVTPTGTLDRSPKMRQKQYDQRSQPAVNHAFHQSTDLSTVPSNFQADSRSVPNMAFRVNKSSTSSDGSAKSNQPLHPHQLQNLQYHQNGLQPVIAHTSEQLQLAGQQLVHLPQDTNQTQQPIQQPLIQNHQLIYQQLQAQQQAQLIAQQIAQQQAQQTIGIPLQQYHQSGQQHSMPVQYETSNDYATIPHVQHQQQKQLFMNQQQPDQNLMQQTPMIVNYQPVGVPVQTSQPQPLPRSNLPIDGSINRDVVALEASNGLPPVTTVSRSITPSSMTFEISMKNSKTSQAVPPKVMNTEL